MNRLAALLMLAVALALAACGGDDDESTTTPVADEPPAETTATEEQGPCRDVEQPASKGEGDLSAPREDLDPEKSWSVVVETSCGEFTIRLDPESAPNAAASFAALAREGFYDDTYFHRIAPGFVIQGGDPTGTGSGGPGYSTEDEPAADTRYTKGVVAMAKTGAEPPGTAGSQFFVVTGEDVGLPPDYAAIGTVTKGIDVVEAIGALGDASEQPIRVVTIDGMEVAGR